MCVDVCDDKIVLRCTWSFSQIILKHHTQLSLQNSQQNIWMVFTYLISKHITNMLETSSVSNIKIDVEINHELTHTV
jgi:hypothetical protein